MRESDLNALTQFDRLPASANVRLPVVSALFSISSATVWRWSKSGNLPPPIRVHGVTMWNVGALRRCLQARQGGDPPNLPRKDDGSEGQLD